MLPFNRCHYFSHLLSIGCTETYAHQIVQAANPHIQPALHLNCPHPSTCSPTLLCCGVCSVRGCIDQGMLVSPRSPPPRTTRHQTPPPMLPRPEWVPTIYTLTHKYILPPLLCIHHTHTAYYTSTQHTPHPCCSYLLTLHLEISNIE